MLIKEIELLRSEHEEFFLRKAASPDGEHQGKIMRLLETCSRRIFFSASVGDHGQGDQEIY